MLIGNAAAPRWWEQDERRFEQYVRFLAGAGATSAELVLHHGPIDARGARVHVLESDWLRIAGKMQRAGFACQLHVSIDPRFDLARWSNDRDGAAADYLPLLRAAVSIGDGQPTPAAFVFHATSSALGRRSDGVEQFKRFVDWADQVFGSNSANLVLCPELRPARNATDRRFDRTRGSMAATVKALARPYLGICWDLGHDWENARFDPEWIPTPDEDFLDLVRHAHLHDAGRDGSMHHPLRFDRASWPEQLALLASHGDVGAVTLEIRYRYALAAGEPWTVLASSYRRALEALAASERRTAPQ